MGKNPRYFLALDVESEFQAWHERAKERLFRELNISPQGCKHAHVTLRPPQEFEAIDEVVEHLRRRAPLFPSIPLGMVGFEKCSEVRNAHEYAVIIPVMAEALRPLREEILTPELWDFAERFLPHISVARYLSLSVANDAVALLSEVMPTGGIVVSSTISLFRKEEGEDWERFQSFNLTAPFRIPA